MLFLSEAGACPPDTAFHIILIFNKSLTKANQTIAQCQAKSFAQALFEDDDQIDAV